MAPGVPGSRRLLVAASLATYVALVFAGLLRVEMPGLGLAHLFYVPIALLALAAGPGPGALAGAAAAGGYLVAARLNPHFASDGESLLSASAAIRLGCFAGIGWLIGTAADRNRELLGLLKQHADRDFLTDLLNTRAFESDLGARLREGPAFTLVLADVDDLKLVNDADGHAAGNDYLRRTAAVLREETEPEDTVARIGGDEFVVLTALGDDASAERLCHRLRAAMAARGLSVSFGWAVHAADRGAEADSLSLFHAADKRLYQGKLGAHGPHRLRSVG